MAGERTLTQGNSTRIVERGDSGRWRLDVIDGSTAYVTDTRSEAPESGDKLQPGEYLIVRATDRQVRYLHAVGADVTFTLQRQ